MKKSEAQIWFYIILIVLVALAFSWLHDQIGSVGIIVLGVLTLTGLIYGSIQSKKRKQQAFDDLALYVLRNRLSPEESKDIYRGINKSNPHKMSLLRNIQILSESTYLATTSKKRKTAESRMELAEVKYSEISRSQIHLVSSSAREKIDRVFSEAQQEYATRLFLNVAEGHIEKSGTLKTAKSQIKYLDLASEVIQEGIDTGDGDMSAFSTALKRIDQLRQDALSDNT